MVESQAGVAGGLPRAHKVEHEYGVSTVCVYGLGHGHRHGAQSGVWWGGLQGLISGLRLQPQLGLIPYLNIHAFDLVQP